MTNDEIRSLLHKHRDETNIAGEYGKIVAAINDTFIDRVLSTGDTASAQKWGGEIITTGYDFWKKIFIDELQKTGRVSQAESVAYRQFKWWNNVVNEIIDKIDETNIDDKI